MDWEELRHAYGSAQNMPELLEQLAAFPQEDSCEDEPWFTIWSSLYHQGDIYSASFAAVPEIVTHLSASPEKATSSFFALPASIEIARKKNDVEVPKILKAPYVAAISELGMLASKWLAMGLKSDVARAAISALSVAAQQFGYAELILEIPPEEVPEVLSWYEER